MDIQGESDRQRHTIPNRKEKRYGKNQKFEYSHNAGCCGIPLIYRFNFAGSGADKPVSF